MPAKTRYFIKQHFDKALQRGYIPMFAKAALKYDFPLALLMAIASRETNMTNMKGDYRKSKHFPGGGYHGYGIMQVDVGTDPQWIASGAWQNVDQAIMHGTSILNSKKNELNRMWQGERTLQQFLWTLSASYNTGTSRAYPDFKASGNPDRRTTGHDYGRDVLQRMQEFSALLADRGITATSYAIQGALNLAALPQAPASVTGGAVGEQLAGDAGAGVVIQSGDSNTVETGKAPEAVAGGGASDPVTTLATSAPVKSGGVKAMVAAIGTAIFTAYQFLGIEIRELFGNARSAFSDSPMGTVTVIVGGMIVLAVYWKYQDRQTQLDLQREKNAHERDLANQAALTDAHKVNVIVEPPVPVAQQEGQPAAQDTVQQTAVPVNFRGI